MPLLILCGNGKQILQDRWRYCCEIRKSSFNTICNGLLWYVVNPVIIDFCNLQFTGKFTRLQMWGHYILSQKTEISTNFVLHGILKNNQKAKGEMVYYG